MLGKYTWDAKAVIILAALAMTCGDCWLIKQLYPYNYFAASAGMLKQFPSDLNLLGIQFKALSMLANTMVELAKCVIKYERLPMKEVHLDYNTMALTKTQIYVATYRIFKGSLEFSAQTTDFVAMNQEKCMFSPLHCFSFVVLLLHPHVISYSLYYCITQLLSIAGFHRQQQLQHGDSHIWYLG